MATGLYLFHNDLRLTDNRLLQRLCQHCEQVLFVYTPLSAIATFRHTGYVKQPLSNPVRAFRHRTLAHLSEQLSQYGHSLYVANTLEDIVAAARQYNISDIAIANQYGWSEAIAVENIKRHLKGINFWHTSNHTLFDKEQLPFQITDIPATFSRFRKQVESSVAVSPVTADLVHFPRPVLCQLPVYDSASITDEPLQSWSCQTAPQALSRYFNTSAPSSYKQTRNALWGEHFSTALSPWLANGALSARQMYAALINYEHKRGANESTYWIYFELLWREYFQWLALKQGTSLFTFKGLSNTPPQTSFYAQRYKAWCTGSTPYPLVNALIKQLNSTGWMSNRGRQIVASCFVNELQLDWRYGAAYFEHQLIDYDVASNYGNWQYIAGVGADPRGGRHFNLTKQTEMFDPDGEFIANYGGQTSALDEPDYVGWPLASHND